VGYFCAGVGLAAPVPAPAQVRSLRAVTYAGKRYVALKDLAGMYGLPLVARGQNPADPGQYISLQFEDERAPGDCQRQPGLAACAGDQDGRDEWSISDADAQFVIDPLVRPSAYLGARGTRTVVLDAGHGGKDPGAVSRNGLQEKAWCWTLPCGSARICGRTACGW
jgi:N-acetylmuramoyl-L-alanine amidase